MFCLTIHDLGRAFVEFGVGISGVLLSESCKFEIWKSELETLDVELNTDS